MKLPANIGQPKFEVMPRIRSKARRSKQFRQMMNRRERDGLPLHPDQKPYLERFNEALNPDGPEPLSNAERLALLTAKAAEVKQLKLLEQPDEKLKHLPPPGEENLMLLERTGGETPKHLQPSKTRLDLLFDGPVNEDSEEADIAMAIDKVFPKELQKKKEHPAFKNVPENPEKKWTIAGGYYTNLDKKREAFNPREQKTLRWMRNYKQGTRAVLGVYGRESFADIRTWQEKMRIEQQEYLEKEHGVRMRPGNTRIV